ncbi:hypothetical protein [Prevotella histicola]|nr:hypothetical protein [Prevotella histicola]
MARIVHGIKYVFGYRSRFGDFDSFEWTGDYAIALQGVIFAIKSTDIR